MGFLSAIKDKVAAKLMGDLITDLGTLPIDEYGREVSLSIRRYAGKSAHLQVQVARSGQAYYFQIVCSREWADQFEKVAQEMRRQL